MALSNGSTEVWHKACVSSSQKDWDRYLNPVLFGYRVSPSEVTSESPFFLLYGRQPRLPMDVSMLPPRVVAHE